MIHSPGVLEGPSVKLARMVLADCERWLADAYTTFPQTHRELLTNRENISETLETYHKARRIIEKHEGAYLKFGLYSSQYEKTPPKADFKRTVYHDELRIARSDGSYMLVSPKNRQIPR